MALASTIGTGSYTLIAPAGWAFLLGRLAIFLGVRVYYGLPGGARCCAWPRCWPGLLLCYASQQHNAVALLQLSGFGMLGTVSLLTLLSLLNSGVSQRSIGAPLAVLGCLLQLLTQAAGMVHAHRCRCLRPVAVLRRRQLARAVGGAAAGGLAAWLLRLHAAGHRADHRAQ